MKKIMLINAVESEEHRIAFITDGMLDGFHIDIASSLIPLTIQIST